VTVGGNDFYAATPGYDMTTGLGSPNVFNIARDLAAIVQKGN
jgi:subtilase family serine protease